MKKRVAVLAVLVLCVAGFYLVGFGFLEMESIYLVDYSVSEDGTGITMQVGCSTSMGYTRGFQDKGGGVKPHYLNFYRAFGGPNGSIGANSEFKLQLDETDREIYFNRSDGGYELVLQKNEATGQWERP